MIVTHDVKSPASVYSSAAQYAIERLNTLTSAGERIVVFISGGSAVNCYAAISRWLLVVGKKKRDLESTIAFAQVDERFRPEERGSGVRGQGSEMDDVNAYQIKKTGLWEACEKLGIPYCTISQKGTLADAARKYESEIEEFFADANDLTLKPSPTRRGKLAVYQEGTLQKINKIAILGIGEDCHTAGLLPGYESQWNTDLWVAGYKNDGRYRERISLTPMAIQNLDEAIVVTVGEKKKQAINDALNHRNKDNLNMYPAAIIQLIPQVHLFTD